MFNRNLKIIRTYYLDADIRIFLCSQKTYLPKIMSLFFIIAYLIMPANNNKSPTIITTIAATQNHNAPCTPGQRSCNTMQTHSLQ